MSYLATSQVLGVDAALPSPPETKCYTVAERQTIAQAITDLKICRVSLAAKDELIQKNMLSFDGVHAGPSFWQAPEFVFGGIVVSVAAGGLVTFLIMRDK